MKNFGYYYDDVHGLILLGFKNNDRNSYTAKVVAHTNYYGFTCGYSYFSWNGLEFIGSVHSFMNVNSYLEWLETAGYEAIKGRKLFTDSIKYRKVNKVIDIFNQDYLVISNNTLSLFKDIIN